MSTLLSKQKSRKSWKLFSVQNFLDDFQRNLKLPERSFIKLMCIPIRASLAVRENVIFITFRQSIKITVSISHLFRS